VRTAPGTIWLLAAAMVLTVGVSTGAAAATRCPSRAGCRVDVTKLSLTGVQVGQALVAILAVLMVSAEYGTGMIRTTLTAIPRPSAVLAAKAAILTGLVLAAGTAGVAGSVLAGRLILPGPWAGLGGRAGRLGRRGAAARRRGPQQARRMSEPEGLKGAPEASGKHSMTGTPP
jgi:ABC-2 type transport system permease protein